ncbi:winged helix-turn-helix transcriptional regulator [Rhizobium halophytocola]|uniref:Transcriptional regulator n=1 Tax=Rhizobium halophytocola TaxID=735519 RepID=A0ABS4DWX3_9HYPH|nr:winged helix-turn-helix transcriptional regulator [Rhizobium halophytocola]MBP1850167.1 putative transcriptional regulator [Rhizobium halophytocola]
MTTLKVKIQTLGESLSAAGKAAAEHGAALSPHVLAFPSWDAMHRVLAPKRLDILKVMAGQGPLTIRELARRVGRDFKGVHTDVDTLLKSGVIDKADGGGIVFPYDRLHFDFDIDAAA